MCRRVVASTLVTGTFQEAMATRPLTGYVGGVQENGSTLVKASPRDVRQGRANLLPVVLLHPHLSPHVFRLTIPLALSLPLSLDRLLNSMEIALKVCTLVGPLEWQILTVQRAPLLI
jgi:hypothetical protein